MSPAGTPHVELGMYAFESVTWAWEAIWAAVHERAPWTPGQLTWSGDTHARWADTDCTITQICGWPLVERHTDDMVVVGAFDLDIPDADHPGHYHSVLVSPHDRPLDQLVGPDTRAVVNSPDSLSGWLSLLVATVGADSSWPGAVTYSSSHLSSLHMLTDGAGDLASIDSWTLALITAEQPELVADLHQVGHGPVVPTPAITTRRSLHESRFADLRAAFIDALRDPATESARATLRISEFVEFDIDDYLGILSLARPS